MKYTLPCSLFLILLCQFAVARDFACPVTAAFSPLNVYARTDTTITFTNNSTGATSYQWLVNGVVHGTSTDFTYTFTGIGDHIVKLRAFDTGCSDSAVGFVVIRDMTKSLTFTKTYPEKFSPHLFDHTLEISDGILISGTYGFGTASLTKITRTGLVIWRKHFSTPGRLNRFHCAVKLQDNEIVVAGISEPETGGGKKISLTRFDESGNIVWQVLYGTDQDTYKPVDILQATDANIYVLLSRGIHNSANSVQLLKIARNGSLIWQKTYQEAALQMGAHDMVARGDKIYITGITFQDSEQLNGSGFVMRVARTNGAVDWSKKYSVADTSMRFTQVLSSGNNLIINAQSTASVLKLDANGTIVSKARPWSGTLLNPLITDGTKLGIYSDTQIVATNYIRTDEPARYIFGVSRLDANLNIKWTRHYSETGLWNIYSVHPTIDAINITATVTGPADLYSHKYIKLNKQGLLPACLPQTVAADTIVPDFSISDLVVSVTESFPEGATQQFTTTAHDLLFENSCYDEGIKCQAAFEPSSVFAKSDTTVTFTNISSGTTNYQWLVNGTVQSTATNFTYTFTGKGDHIVQLRASTIGCEQWADGAVVTRDTSKSLTFINTYYERWSPYLFSQGIETPDGHLLMTGIKIWSSGALTKITKGGTIIWQKNLAAPDRIDEFYCAVKTTDNRILVAGRSYILANGHQGVTFTKLDVDGNILWQKIYPGNESIVPAKIIQGSNGYFYVAATGTLNSPENKVTLLKLTNEGELVWTRIYTTASGLHTRSRDLAEIGDQLYISGSAYPDTEHLSGSGFLMQVSKNTGDIGWAKKYAIDNLATTFTQIFSSGNHLIVNCNQASTVLKLDQNGDIVSKARLWNRTMLAGMRLGVYKDTQIVVANVMRPVQTDGSYILGITSLDSNLNIRWNRQYDKPVGFYWNLNWVHPTANGIFITGTQVGVTDRYWHSLVRVDNEGLLTACPPGNAAADTIPPGITITDHVFSAVDFNLVDSTHKMEPVLGGLSTQIVCFDDGPKCAKVTLGADTTICPATSVTLHAGSHFINYQWQDGSTSESLLITTPGTYWVQVTDSNQCISRDTIEIQTSTECPQAIYFPNAFTPNNDGLNDIFRSIVKGHVEFFQFTVFNRQGAILYESTDPGQGWDGKIKGLSARRDTYIWVCTYKFPGQEQRRERGTVTLIR